jgi:hypothetical protein
MFEQPKTVLALDRSAIETGFEEKDLLENVDMDVVIILKWVLSK